MSKEKNKSTLEEAAFELESILETATKNAQDKLAKDMPEKFESLLNEEINKNKENESVDESVKGNTKKEPTNEGKKTDNNKESLNEMEDVDMTNLSIGEVEEAYDQANDADEFSTIDIGSIADELKQMDGISQEMDVKQAEEVVEVNEPYDRLKEMHNMMSEMVKEMEDQKFNNEMVEAFNGTMVETYGEGYQDNLGEGQYDTLLEMFKANQGGDPYNKTGSVNESEFIGESPMVEDMGGDAVSQAFQALLAAVKQIHPQVDSTIRSASQHQTSNMDAHGRPINAGVEDVLGQGVVEQVVESEDLVNQEEEKDEPEIDEAHGITHANNRTVGSEKQPRDAGEKKPRVRAALRKENWDKRMGSLISENKKLTKQNLNLNESVKVNETKEGDNTAVMGKLKKFKNQLQEMATINTNIAHVNDLLIKESNLSVDDKQNIINKFKNVGSISESENVYNNIISEMKGKKGEGEALIESKINDTLGESSSKKIVEQVVEKTAYSGKGHINEMLKRINYVPKK